MMNGQETFPNFSGQSSALVDFPIPPAYQDSMNKILQYANISGEKADLFKNNVKMYFNRTGERAGTEALKARETVISIFFEIYTEVAKKSWKEQNPDRPLQMFLKYCYMDENLLKAEHIRALDSLPETAFDTKSGSIFYLSDWLQKIYSKEINPSVNEYEQDYFDVFRDKKRKGQLREQDKPAYENDVEGRLRHEVDNLFKIGQRLCFGRTRGYFPILCNETAVPDLKRSLVTPAAIEKSLKKVTNIDFSAFFRESVYHENNSNNPMTYIIMKSALPDIILLPTCGSRGVMWQEISGRVKASPARFIFPIFTDENLDNLMASTIAKFRWELSKNVSGSVGNRAFDKSLYSEFTDYIQTYKKNRHLSADMKEKIRLQIDRKRNNVGEIFTEDYLTWINFESRGLLRLNKVVRGILFKYCPFSKPIRDVLITNPQYNQLITQYNYGSAKAAHIWDSKLSKMSQPIDQDLIDNLNYYRM